MSLSYHIVLRGGIISVMIAFGTNPGIIARLMYSGGLFGRNRKGPLYRPAESQGDYLRNLFLRSLSWGSFSFCTLGIRLFYNYRLPLSIVFSLFWSTMVIALLPIWENLFDVISPLRLLELSHPSQPLLKRLQIEAPAHITIL